MTISDQKSCPSTTVWCRFAESISDQCAHHKNRVLQYACIGAAGHKINTYTLKESTTKQPYLCNCALRRSKGMLRMDCCKRYTQVNTHSIISVSDAVTSLRCDINLSMILQFFPLAVQLNDADFSEVLVPDSSLTTRGSPALSLGLIHVYFRCDTRSHVLFATWSGGHI